MYADVSNEVDVAALVRPTVKRYGRLCHALIQSFLETLNKSG